MRIQCCIVNDRGRWSGVECCRGDLRASHLLAVEGDSLVGPYATCDHEVSEKASTGGHHEAGKEANVRDGG